jgi:small subunit ribosomal protein S18
MAEEVKAVKPIKAVKEERKSSSEFFSDVFNERTVTEDDEGESRRRRKKVILNLKCPLCETGVKLISYKDVYQLKKFTSVRGKIIGREKSGMCAKHQRQLSGSIKRARYMALLPYAAVSR